MYAKYSSWMKNLKLDSHTAYGKCELYSKEMNEKFPELILVRGHYDCLLWGLREHWWLKDKNGTIIDPTYMQFISGGTYIELDESLPEPTGKCPQCGEYTYNNQSLHDECASKYMNYLNGV